MASGLMMTVRERDEDILRSIEQGARSYIRKPMTQARFAELFRDFEPYWSLMSRIPPLKR
jgi:DNA-binding response OmpR family regulator